MLMKTDSVRVYDPRGVIYSENVPTSQRKKALGGLRLGILDNSKWNANKLLRGAAAALKSDIDFAAVNYYVKESFSKDAAPELIARMAAENDIVLTAIGDCGSCCSACVRDSIALEKRGIPSAVIITTEFVRETELTRQALGMQTLEPVVIAHPVSSITQDEVAQRVAQIKTQAQQVWLGTKEPLPKRVELQ
ncbi:MAG: UGSC family (seleno)protein [Pseudomonadota bacterium]